MIVKLLNALRIVKGVRLVDHTGDHYVTIRRRSVNGGYWAHVYWVLGVGHVVLNDDHTCGGSSSYIEKWWYMGEDEPQQPLPAMPSSLRSTASQYRSQQQAMMGVSGLSQALMNMGMGHYQSKQAGLATAQQLQALQRMASSGWVQPGFIQEVAPIGGIAEESIAALQNTEPRKVQKPVPDMVAPIVAWRAWSLQGNCLAGLGQDTLWPVKQKLEAVCLTHGALHRAPVAECNCGVWAFKSLENLRASTGRYPGILVFGQVELWGRVVETENGFRAQFAYPKELWLLDSSLEKLGLIYDVPVRTLPEKALGASA